MKRIIYIISCIAVIGTLASCDEEEFLERPAVDQLNSDTFWRDITDAEAGLTATYAQLEGRRWLWSGWQEGRPVVDYFRADYIIPGPDSFNYANWQEFFNFTYNNGNNFISVLWDLNYYGLNYANQVITRVGEMTPEQIDASAQARIIGEAKFLRGYYHFRLLNLYEKIVLRMEMVSADNLAKPLAERSEVWQAIIQDFTEAAAVLPATYDSQNVGRATRGAAYAYLGKAYLHKAGDASSSEGTDIDNAATALKNVIDLNVYSLTTDFIGMFNGNNENSTESIFEVQVKTSDANSNNSSYLQFFVADPCIDGWGEIETNTAFLTKLQSEGMVASGGTYDKRLYASLFFDDPYYNDEGNPRMRGDTWDNTILNYYGSADAKDDTAYFKKYIPDNLYYYGVNLMLMRYADVLLMYAEALNETGQTAAAIPYINQVRSVHGEMPDMTGSTQEEVRQQIIHERLIEFTLEASRFNDLRRWGMLDSAMQAAGRTGFNSTEHSYLPIPLSEVNANPLID